jgi:hypothetical protein
MIGSSFATSSCVTRQGWKQEGKTEQNLMKDDGECFAQAQTAGAGNAFSINREYGRCMHGRGWTKD